MCGGLHLRDPCRVGQGGPARSAGLGNEARGQRGFVHGNLAIAHHGAATDQQVGDIGPGRARQEPGGIGGPAIPIQSCPMRRRSISSRSAGAPGASRPPPSSDPRIAARPPDQAACSTGWLSGRATGPP
jgi:hypothetical protein